jgi:hypothetical protein
MSLFTNFDQIEDLMENPLKMFKGPEGFNIAAISIQKKFRGYRAFYNFKQLEKLMKFATKI